MIGFARILFVCAALFVAFGSKTSRADAIAPRYPATPRGDVIDSYFGTRVPDPYRWLERIDSGDTQNWVAAETTLTEQLLAAMPERNHLRRHFETLFRSPNRGLAQRGGDIAVFSQNDGRSGHGILVVTRGEQGRERVLLDPAAMWHDGVTSLSDIWSLAPNGRYLAYPSQRAGSDWVTWHVRDVSTGRDLPDSLIGAKNWAPIAWAHDGSGFYYGAYDASANFESLTSTPTNYKVLFHHVATAQGSDRLIYRRPDEPAWIPYVNVSIDGRYLLIGAINGASASNMLSVKDLRNPRDQLHQIAPIDSAKYRYVTNDGPIFYLFTDFRAPHGKLIAIDVRRPNVAKTVIPESASTLDSIRAVGNQFIVHYLKDVQSSLVLFDHRGRHTGRVKLPGVGSVGTVDADARHSDAYFIFSSMSRQYSIIRYDTRSRTLAIVYQKRTTFDPASYVTEALFARSKDGTRIPVFVAHRRGLRLDGRAPALLYGYGAFGDSTEPAYYGIGEPWLARGGVFVIACVRGGGEYGEAWHRAGMLANKQNSFDDFASAAQMLISRGYASHQTLAAYGYSGAGLLVAITMIQHPSLFRATVVGAAEADVLREQLTGGAVWVPEFGSSTASPAQFEALYRYAPLVHIQRGVIYPATFVWTSDHDDRVFPANSYKLAATLQWAQAGNNPIVLSVARNAGHGGGASSRQNADQFGDAEAFLLHEVSNHR